MDPSLFFLFNDQPTTCPYCGARTHWVDFYDFDGDYQLNFCLAYPYKHIFLTCDDDDDSLQIMMIVATISKGL